MQATWTLAGLWLAHTAAAGSLVLLVTLTWMRLVRQPAWRQRLGEIGLAAALLAAVAALGPAWLHLPWLPAEQSEPLTFGAKIRDKKSEPSTGVASETDQDAVEWFAWTPVESATQEPASMVFTPQAQAAVPSSAAMTTAGPELVTTAIYTVIVAYGLGASFFLIRWLVGWIGLRRILRDAESAPDDICHFFRRKTAVEPTPRLLMSRRLRVPVSCGIWRPTIVLPVSLCRPPDHGRLPWVFAHELTHLVRHDAWSSVLFALGQVVFFYLPWFWSLRRQVRLCQEFVADAAAVTGRPADEYAAFLLSLIASQAVPLAATGVSGNRSDLYRRVSMLLKSPMRVEQTCPRSWTWASAGVLLALAVIIGGVGLKADAGGGRIIVIEPGGKQPVDVFKFKPAPGPTAVRIERPAGDAIDKDIVFFDPAQDGRADVLFRNPGDGKRAFLFKIDVGPHGKVVAEKPVQGRDAIILNLVGVPRGDVLGPQGLEVKPIQVNPTTNLFKPASDAVKLLQDVIIDLHPGEQADKDKQDKELADLLKMIENLGGQDGEKIRKQVEEALKKATKHIQDFQLKVDGVPGKVREAIAQSQALGEWKLQDPAALGRVVLWDYGPHGSGRLGAKLVKPSAILAEQLNLPKGMGMVVQEVQSDSPAAKAGIKVNDILLLHQDVASDAAKFNKMLESLKKDGNLDLKVLRKGKEENLKGIPVADLLQKQAQEAWFALPGILQDRAWTSSRALGRSHGVVTTIFRNIDRFNTRHQEGSLIITIIGKVEGGKAAPQEIHIQDGNTSNRYESADRVPSQYRDKVNHLIQTSGGPTQVESK
ncbi:MAG: PDZ domain-containing protein [Planctomycetes bacterium]|nr:PDZ domain-containing protein [Planctomycetota bacterium]